MVNEELAERVTELATWLDENVDPTDPDWTYEAAALALEWVQDDAPRSYEPQLHFDYLLLGLVTGAGLSALVVFIIAAWLRAI